ncbi:hypothetical protein ASE17_15310 [Phenylobacterium sp. Root77]|uniref:DUF6491 family protein n=1 Tax=unclassified Phenylobacterium TaxID=2640670 RepID=UPI0006F30D14|nr:MULTISPECIES: DUF6491 family protein [unclassified Phenylobacterium]KQW70974.1 hypothetical protein ASC73_13070 [Phenylobacterium sp. Root1277]KQW95868.1 hypothetical protein ASC79_09370 [Phenylobacterium sp. Root1290]KRC41653.1 hypothetical protein ASE17_15310 [Phenylobacterium sp. Root77]
MKFAWAGLAGVLALGACTTSTPSAETAAASPTRNCFWANSANSFNAVDDQTVYVRVGVRDVYRLDLFTRCPDVDWNTAIALQSRGGSSICSGLDATVLTKGPFGPQRCQVRTVTKLTPEEVAAMNPRAKP